MIEPITLFSTIIAVALALVFLPLLFKSKRMYLIIFCLFLWYLFEVWLLSLKFSLIEASIRAILFVPFLLLMSWIYYYLKWKKGKAKKQLCPNDKL